MSGGNLWDQAARWRKQLALTDYAPGEPEYCRNCADETPHNLEDGRLLCGDCKTDARAERKKEWRSPV